MTFDTTGGPIRTDRTDFMGRGSWVSAVIVLLLQYNLHVFNVFISVFKLFIIISIKRPLGIMFSIFFVHRVTLASFANNCLWSCYLHNNHHLLHYLLPPASAASQSYNLRRRPHNQLLPQHLGHLLDSNFITRILYKTFTDATV